MNENWNPYGSFTSEIDGKQVNYYHGRVTEDDARMLDGKLSFMYGKSWLKQQPRYVNNIEVQERYIPFMLSAESSYAEIEKKLNEFDSERYNVLTLMRTYVQVRRLLRPQN